MINKRKKINIKKKKENEQPLVKKENLYDT